MRTAVVTGASSGIGLAMCRLLAQRGFYIIGIGQNPARCCAAENDLKSFCERSVVIACDVSNQSGLDNVAQQVGNLADQVDIIVNNAGVLPWRRYETNDGLELNWAVHHIAPFGLTSRLWPLLLRSDRPRVINTSSNGHKTSLGGYKNPTLDFSDLQGKLKFNPFLAYSCSKLANLYFSFSLAEKYGGMVDVVANHPGLVRTRIARSFPSSITDRLLQTALTPNQAAHAMLPLLIDPLPMNGGYYEEGHLSEPSPAAQDYESRERTWLLTEEFDGSFPRIFAPEDGSDK